MSERRKGSPSGDQITHERAPPGAWRPGAQSSFPRAQLSLRVTAWRSQGRRQELDRQDRRGRPAGPGGPLIPTPQPRRITGACDCRSSGVLGPGAPGEGAGGVSEGSGDPRWETLSLPSPRRRGAARLWAAPRGPPRRPLTCQAGGPRVGPWSMRETQAGFSRSPAQPDPFPSPTPRDLAPALGPSRGDTRFRPDPGLDAQGPPSRPRLRGPHPRPGGGSNREPRPALRPRVPSAALRQGAGREGAGPGRAGTRAPGRWRGAGARPAGRMLTRARDVRAGTGLPEAGLRRRRAETGSRAEQGRAAERRGGAEQQSSGGSAGRRAPEPAAPPPGPRHAGSGRRAATPEPAAAGRAGHERGGAAAAPRTARRAQAVTGAGRAAALGPGPMGAPSRARGR